MKQLINGKLYDTAKALQVLTVDAPTGTRTLFLSGHYNFFILEATGQIIPLSKNQVVDFLELVKDQVPEMEIQHVYDYYLPASYSRKVKISIPTHARKIATANDEQLFYFARKFFIRIGGTDKKFTQAEALNWIELHQAKIELDEILPFFPRIKKAWF